MSKKINRVLTNQTGFAHILIVAALVTLSIGGIGSFVAVKHAQHNQQVNQAAEVKKNAAKLAELSAKDKTKLEQASVAKTAQTAAPVVTPSPTTTSDCTRSTTLYVTSSDGLRLHAGKSNDSQTLVGMPYRASLKGGCPDGTWYSVEYGGKIGFSLSQYLSTSQPAAPSLAPTPQPVNANINHPTAANCNSVHFTVYASVPSGTPAYGLNNSSTVLYTVPYKNAITDVYCDSDSNGKVFRLDNGANASYSSYNMQDVSLTQP